MFKQSTADSFSERGISKWERRQRRQQWSSENRQEHGSV